MDQKNQYFQKPVLFVLKYQKYMLTSKFQMILAKNGFLFAF